MLPTAVTDCSMLVLEMWASTFMRGMLKLSETALCPDLPLPRAPAAVTLTIWPLTSRAIQRQAGQVERVGASLTHAPLDPPPAPHRSPFATCPLSAS